MLKVDAQTSHSLAKGNSNEHLCSHPYNENAVIFKIKVITCDKSWFSFNITEKLSTNLHTGRISVHKDKIKHEWAIQIQSYDQFLSISKIVFMLIGYLKVCTLISSTTRFLTSLTS